MSSDEVINKLYEVSGEIHVYLKILESDWIKKSKIKIITNKLEEKKLERSLLNLELRSLNRRKMSFIEKSKWVSDLMNKVFDK